ncbi:hypothetical protein MNV49_001156 [Pseudohyphozyma bogoriensis]|nr:hypothetical protein MNV49_001156 [Pseudohyphozyma bogoriensis]
MDSPLDGDQQAFPNELYGHIIKLGHLPRVDLASCCLVSKAFAHFATPELYHNVGLSWNEDTSAPSQILPVGLLDTLATNPTLGTFMRRLTLDCRHVARRGDGGLPAIQLLLYRSGTSIRHFEMLNCDYDQAQAVQWSLAALLEHVQSYTLTTTDPWNALPFPSRLKNLTYLDLHGNFDADPLSDFHLVDLTIRNVVSPDAFDDLTASSRATLRSLTLKGFFTILPISLASFLSLHHVSLHIRRDVLGWRHGGPGRLVSTCPSLRTLAFHFEGLEWKKKSFSLPNELLNFLPPTVRTLSFDFGDHGLDGSAYVQQILGWLRETRMVQLFSLASALAVLLSTSTAMNIPFLQPQQQQQLPLSAPAAPLSDYPNRVVFIRHGEKPGRAGMGLSEIGKQRAQCLRDVFGKESEFDFGLVFAAPRDQLIKDQERTYMTVSPLAEDLGLDIEISCANEPASCVANKIEEFVKTSDKDVLICWKHRDLVTIARALGAHAYQGYPDDRNDIMWIMEGHEIVEKRSEHCPIIDARRIDDASDADLALEA